VQNHLKSYLYYVLVFYVILAGPSYALVTFSGTELLGRPTDHSVMVNVVADTDIEAYVEYGTTPGTYPQKTQTMSGAAHEPLEFLLDELTSSTRYYYRLRYRESGSAKAFSARNEFTCHTKRSPTETFVFTIISDSHLGFVRRIDSSRFRSRFNTPALYTIACQNVSNDHPDFHFDLGDTFSLTGTQIGDVRRVHGRYMAQRPFMGLFTHSTPIFLVIGNHEEEEGWNLDDAGKDYVNSLPVMSANGRKRYFFNPIPNGFYSGNTDNSRPEIHGDHLKEDYFAFEWGCALFVALDPYWYTTVKPFVGRLGGENTDDDTPPADRWRWTLGRDQYTWLKQTLEQSSAKYKFVFAHQVTGGGGLQADYGRGGEKASHDFEWGAGPAAFAAHRPGWDSDKSIHRLFLDTKVDIFFHGHDHVFALEKVDGMIYQECPFPANAAYSFGFGAYKDNPPETVVRPNSGHIRVTVSPEKVIVDYIRAFLPADGKNGKVEYSYTVTNDIPLPAALKN